MINSSFNINVLPFLIRSALSKRLVYYTPQIKFFNRNRRIMRRSRITNWEQINTFKAELNLLQRNSLVNRQNIRQQCVVWAHRSIIWRNIKRIRKFIRRYKFMKKESTLYKFSRMPYIYKKRFEKAKKKFLLYARYIKGLGKVRSRTTGKLLCISSSGRLVSLRLRATRSIILFATFLSKKKKNKALLTALYKLNIWKQRIGVKKRSRFKWLPKKKGRGFIRRDVFIQPRIQLGQNLFGFRAALPIITITFKENNIFFVLSNCQGKAILIMSSGLVAKKSKLKLKASSVPAYNEVTKAFAKKVSRLSRRFGLRIHGTSRRKKPIIRNLKRGGIRFAFVIEHQSIICNGVRKSRKRRK